MQTLYHGFDCVLLQDLSASVRGSSGSGHTFSRLFGFGSKSSKPPPPLPKKVPSLPKVHGAAPPLPSPEGNESGSEEDEEDVSVNAW